MRQMEYLLKLSENITVDKIIVILAALYFLYNVGVKIYKFIVTKHDDNQDKEKDFQDIKDELKKIQQKQEKLENDIKDIKQSQDSLLVKQTDFEEQNKLHNLNKLRNILLQSYRYYASDEKNPLHAWSEMEKESFDKLFNDYEDLGGNGFMHSTVEPAMASLEVITMDDSDKLSNLMKSRKG